MKVWFDADNGPHVLIMKPLIAELRAQGHEIVCTARDRTSTVELMRLYGIPCRKVGGTYAGGMSGKVKGTLERAFALSREMRGEHADVSFGHGSRALPIAAKLLGVPSVTMYDYEWVNAALFNWGCRRILLPEVISAERCRAAGIDRQKVLGYPGFKEELYVGGQPLDDSIGAALGLRDGAVHILVRPPATTAHYHNPEADSIYLAILARVAATADIQLVLLPRSPDQVAAAKAAGVKELIVPTRVFDGPSLVAAMDVVISGGGTMTREAAIMGIPSYSFFRGRSGMVDESLTQRGRLLNLKTRSDADNVLQLHKRGSTPTMPDPTALIRFITSAILTAADQRR